jgi:hypothetical protein
MIKIGVKVKDDKYLRMEEVFLSSLMQPHHLLIWTVELIKSFSS